MKVINKEYVIKHPLEILSKTYKLLEKSPHLHMFFSFDFTVKVRFCDMDIMQPVKEGYLTVHLYNLDAFNASGPEFGELKQCILDDFEDYKKELNE